MHYIDSGALKSKLYGLRCRENGIQICFLKIICVQLDEKEDTENTRKLMLLEMNDRTALIIASQSYSDMIGHNRMQYITHILIGS